LSGYSGILKATHESIAGNMRTVGMIGGLGPESTIDYYHSIIARFRSRKPDAGYPHIIINSPDADKVLAILDAGRLDELADYLDAGVQLLVRAGADFGFIAANGRILCSTRSSAGPLYPCSVLSAPPAIMQERSA
jgi:2-iminoacetate synthase ThiH